MKAPWETGFEDPLRQNARFDPGTAALMLAAGGVSAIGSLTSGISAYSTGKANQANANAQATAVQQAAGERAQQQGTETERQVGEAVADAGASGVDPSTGSPLAATSDLASQGKLAQLLTLYQGATQASSLRYGGALAATQGTRGLAGGIIGAGATLLQAGALYKNLTVPNDAASAAAVGNVNTLMSGSGFYVPRY